MFIKNGKRFNIYAPFTDPDTGVKGINMTLPENRSKYGVTEIAEPAAPEDYSEDMYFRTEQDTEPYVIYTRKADEVINAALIKKFIAAMESYYDKVAQVKQYDNRVTCTMRAGYAGPFQAEGQAFAVWMDSCNAYGYVEMDKVLNGERQVPTIESFIAELPPPPWELPADN